MSKIRANRNNGNFDNLIKHILNAESEEEDFSEDLDSDIAVEEEECGLDSEDFQLSHSEEEEIDLNQILDTKNCSFRIVDGQVVLNDTESQIKHADVSHAASLISKMQISSKPKLQNCIKDDEIKLVKNKRRARKNIKRCGNYDD